MPAVRRRRTPNRNEGLRRIQDSRVPGRVNIQERTRAADHLVGYVPSLAVMRPIDCIKVGPPFHNHVVWRGCAPAVIALQGDNMDAPVIELRPEQRYSRPIRRNCPSTGPSIRAVVGPAKFAELRLRNPPGGGSSVGSTR
jgi:hypothetical protein